jgi:hypothetical protein
MESGEAVSVDGGDLVSWLAGVLQRSPIIGDMRVMTKHPIKELYTEVRPECVTREAAGLLARTTY